MKISYLKLLLPLLDGARAVVYEHSVSHCVLNHQRHEIVVNHNPNLLYLKN